MGILLGDSFEEVAFDCFEGRVGCGVDEKGVAEVFEFEGEVGGADFGGVYGLSHALVRFVRRAGIRYHLGGVLRAVGGQGLGCISDGEKRSWDGRSLRNL